MKTVEQYLQEIPGSGDARERAIKNCDSEKKDEWSTSLPAALKRAFLWHKTPEGYDYWQTVYDAACLYNMI